MHLALFFPIFANFKSVLLLIFIVLMFYFAVFMDRKPPLGEMGGIYVL